LCHRAVSRISIDFSGLTQTRFSNFNKLQFLELRRDKSDPSSHKELCRLIRSWNIQRNHPTRMWAIMSSTHHEMFVSTLHTGRDFDSWWIMVEMSLGSVETVSNDEILIENRHLCHFNSTTILSNSLPTSLRSLDCKMKRSWTNNETQAFVLFALRRQQIGWGRTLGSYVCWTRLTRDSLMTQILEASATSGEEVFHAQLDHFRTHYHQLSSTTEIAGIEIWFFHVCRLLLRLRCNSRLTF
jgi:hypothetical protein